MPYPPLRGLLSVCKTFLKNLMAILLVVLPNSTILDPSKPKTCPSTAVEPPGWCPLLVIFRKRSPLFLIQALMNYIPVKFQRSKWRHLLSSSPTQSGSCFSGIPCKHLKQSCGGRVLSCSWSGTFSFLLNYIILSRMFICLFFFF